MIISLSTYSHTAIIDSGTNMHVLQQTLFADNTYEKHSSVASFSGNTRSHTDEVDPRNEEAIDTRLSDHQKLGHPYFKRMRNLDIDGITVIPPGKKMKPISCPVCIASKMRKPNRPIASTHVNATAP